MLFWMAVFHGLRQPSGAHGKFENRIARSVLIRQHMHHFGLRHSNPSQRLPAFECRPVLVNTASPDEKGCLIMIDGRLVAVLVHVAGTGVERDREKLSGWYVEAGFGRCAVPAPPLFGTLADAVTWMCTRLGVRQSATITL